MRIRRLEPRDRDDLAALLSSDATFNAEEVAVALELIDETLTVPTSTYEVRVCEAEDRSAPCRILGYVCYGRTPMTVGTYDLYWVATHRLARGRGVATRLVEAMERDLRERGARIVRIETSQLGEYDAARAFYARLAYREVGRIADFYRQGDDLVTLAKRLDVPAELAAGEYRPAQKIA